VQIATGLAAAHTALITHRDLKPANILLTRDGRIKILDFGLAKMSTVPSAFQSDFQSELGDTETLPLKTDPGVVMGTVGYMSPEQVKGLVADHRSDIFSFGVILYELLSGRRAFHRDTAIETMRAILKEDPPELPDTVPAVVRQVVHHCLEKEPENRFQSARDLAFALSAMSHSSGGSNLQSGIAKSLPGALPAWSPWLKRAVLATAALVLIAAGVAGGRVLWNTPAASEWSGEILGGPEMALDPRISPDGSLLAFQAFDRGNTQVAVMKPESGNWSILTRSRERGFITVLAWSADGASIYYDRLADVPQGVYSVPLLGGDEHLVLENAGTPQPLPDGSVLVFQLNNKRETQLFRFWPETGRLQDLPVVLPKIAGTSTAVLRVDPDGKQAVVAGRRIGRENEPADLLVVDLGTGAARTLTPGTPKDNAPRAFAVSRDGKSVIAAFLADSLARITTISLNGRSAEQTLFTVANMVWYLDSGPDGSVYLSLMDRSEEVVRQSLGGGQAEHIASFPTQVNDLLAVLPDGRAVVTARTGGRARLMVAGKAKDLVPLISTPEETSGPMTVAGPREIAFVTGSAPHQTIAVADTASGRIVRRIPLNKGDILSLASSPEGKTLYAAAGGSIWAVSSSGGEPRMIRAGDSVTVDPSGRQLVIAVNENSKFRLFRVPVDGGSEQEVVTDGSIPLGGFALSANALNADGRLLHPLSPVDDWFNPPGLLDIVTGRITRIPSDDGSDYHSLAWLPDGRIMALRVGLRSTLWKFQPRK
jgi:DNA-binding beta-propeller fold protein YncE